MEEILRQEVIKKTCASIYLGCLSEYKRNLEELRKSWQNSLKRHEAKKPSLVVRILTSGAVLKAWSERREALLSNVTSCDERIRRIDDIIASGNASPEVIEYVEALVYQLQSIDLSV